MFDCVSALAVNICCSSDESTPGEKLLICPEVYRPLFLACAKNYGTSAFVGSACVQDGGGFQKLLDGMPMDFEIKRSLQLHFPILHELASALQWTEIPEQMLAFFEYLSGRALKPFASPEVCRFHTHSYVLH